MNEYKIRPGYSQCNVLFTDDAGKTAVIQKGIVIQSFGSFVRVHNPMSPSSGGDATAEMSECFPVAGRRCWCEFLKERDNPFPIPPLFK